MVEYHLRNLPILLQAGDKFFFELKKKKTLQYVVERDHLSYRGGDNLQIFSHLNIYNGYRELLRRAYGYPLYGGNWPECKHEDYGALTRAVWLLLYEQTVREEFKVRPVEFLINPSGDLMDLKSLLEAKHLTPIQEEVIETFCRVRGYNFRELL